jgi:tetratricopeptide (TPR) repeat protein
MRRLCVVLALGLLVAGNALADTITITAPWTQVRRTPSMDGRAIDIVYGNDTFTVLESKDGWAKIRTLRKVVGWVLLNDADLHPGETLPGESQPAPASAPGAEKKADAAPPPNAPPPRNLEATTLSNATALAKLGYRDQAREKFTDLILGNPGNVEAYESARQMLAYYPVGYLPPLKNGQVTSEGQESIGKVLPAVLLQEAIALQSGKQYARASRVYEFLVERDGGNGRAFLGLLDTLQGRMADALKASQEAELGAAVASYRTHFPDQALPDAVQQHLSQAKKS